MGLLDWNNGEHMKLLDSKQDHLLFVCTGNTCRSPMAAAVFNHFAEEKNSSWFAQSAGLAAETGVSVSPNAVTALKDYGIYVEDHISYQLEERMIRDSKLVLTMTETQRDLLRIYYPAFKDKILSLAEFSGHQGDIEDPYGKDLIEYQKLARTFMDIMPHVVDKLTHETEV